MKLKSILISVIIFIPITFYAQVEVNIGVIATSNKAKIVIEFYNKYINDFTVDNMVNYGDYFFENDIKGLTYPDKIAFGLVGNTSNYYLGTPYLLALDVRSDTVMAKMLFASIDSLGNLSTNFIANYYFLVHGNSCKFLVTQNIETRLWEQTTVRNVTFHYPKYHEFNFEKANLLIHSIIELEKDWDVPSLPIDYYFADTDKEIQAIKGYDFNFYMARSSYPFGLSYQSEKSVFCSGYDENYFHEIVHLYLNPLYPKTPLKEGIATFYGGSGGMVFRDHLIRLNEYIIKHPEINIANQKEFYYMDEQTNPKYAIQAFICYLVFEKKGVKGLKNLLKTPSLNEVYQNEFGVIPAKQNDFMRQQIQQFVEKSLD